VTDMLTQTWAEQWAIYVRSVFEHIAWTKFETLGVVSYSVFQRTCLIS